MAARKNRPVLYEVVRRSSQQRATKSPLTESPLRSAALSRSPAELVAEPTVDRPAPPAPPAAAPRVSAPRNVPAAAPRESQFRFSARGSNAAIIAAASVLLLVIIYVANRWSPNDQPTLDPSERPTSDYVRTLPAGDAKAVDGDQPAGSAVETPSSDDGRTADDGTETGVADGQESGTPAVELIRGKHYVIVQYFPRGKRAAAAEAAKFLMENGVPCALLPGERDIRLIATEGFDVARSDGSESSEQRRLGEALVRRIKELGKTYFPKGGYRFDGAQLRRIR